MTTSTDLKTFKIAKGTKAQIVTAYNNGDIGDTDFAIATDEVYAAMPDYSAGVSVATTAGTTYTATTDGIFVGICNATSAGAWVRFYIKDSNDNSLGIFGNYSPLRTSDTVSAGCIAPLPKGYKVEIVSVANATCTFYPMKGV